MKKQESQLWISDGRLAKLQQWLGKFGGKGGTQRDLGRVADVASTRYKDWVRGSEKEDSRMMLTLV